VSDTSSITSCKICEERKSLVESGHQTCSETNNIHSCI